MNNLNIFPDDIKKIAILTLAGPIEAASLQKGINAIRQMGIEVIVPECTASNGPSYVASSIEQRVNDLHAMWQRDDIDAILCARGGYGTMQLLPYINWKLLKQRPLPLIGYSDITALHLAMVSHGCGIPLTAPMAIHMKDLINCSFSSEWFKWALDSSSSSKTLSNTNSRIIKKMNVKAPMYMVNLTMLCALCGTSYLPDFSGKILVVEDINEPAYAIDRKLAQLKLTGMLSQCSGLIFGSFSGCDNFSDLEYCFKNYAEDIKGPVLLDFPFGHHLPMISAPYGVELEIRSDGSLILAKGTNTCYL